ncbi:MAG TPA: hypothetical protein VHV53_08530 [Solirubrobacterales bacterium]|jgi:hypothetical protein|nr:hypothetical protein [Solirubrobacterales bacterium]
MESGSTPPDNRIPRGAIVVVVVGIIATIAAALLTSGKGGGEAAHLEFVQKRAIPDSKPIAVPGSNSAQMQLVDGKIQATGANVSGYMLFRVLTTLKIDKGAPVGGGRILCSIHATGGGTEIAQSSGGLRMLYPRSSEDGIYGQPVPETVLAQFSSHGYELAELEEVFDDMPERWTTIQGVKLEWPEYEVGTEHLKYFLPEGKAKATIELPFYSIWRSTKPPAAQIACRLKVAAGTATAETEGALPRVSPPINEEAEEEKQEEREEVEKAAEESEESEGE